MGHLGREIKTRQTCKRKSSKGAHSAQKSKRSLDRRDGLLHQTLAKRRLSAPGSAGSQPFKNKKPRLDVIRIGANYYWETFGNKLPVKSLQPIE
jgi:hypothetical protein